MLAKKNRLTESKEFKKVQTQGKVYQSKNFGLAYLERRDSEPSKFGFVVSTKIAKDAVDRNRFKRSMSESVRTSLLRIKPGYNIVFLAKMSIIRSPTSEVMKETKNALKDAGLME